MVKIFAVAALTLLVFCGGVFAATPLTENHGTFLVTPQWLKANLGKVVLIDARASSLYNGQTGHIPGAVNAEWTYFASLKGRAGDPGWGSVWPAQTMAKRLGALGIDGKRPVVVYGDAGDWGQSAWVIWILRMGGFNNAKMLDGGFSAWRAAGGVTSKTPHKAKPVAFPSFKAYNNDYIISTKQVAELVQSCDVTVKIIDVRTPNEYKGEIRPFQERRAGHIPGAINIPMDKVFTEDYRIRSAEEVKGILAGFGITDPAHVLVVYDTAGVRSSFMTMIFRLAGFSNARTYSPSFHEWAGNSELPLNIGENP